MKKNAWNIRRLVDESFVQASYRAIVIYFRLSDFKTSNKTENDEWSLKVLERGTQSHYIEVIFME